MPGFLDKLTGLVGRRGGGRFTAVDFDRRILRVVQAEQTPDGVRILKLASAPMPAHLDLEDPKAVGEFLARALQEARLGSGGVLMNVPRSQAVLKPLSLPPGASTDEMASMVQYQIGKELPFPAEGASVDFAMERHYNAEGQTGPEPKGSDVLVAAVRGPVVEHYRRIAEAAGVRLLRLGLRPYADLRAVQAYGRIADGESVAVLHLTADEVEINVVMEGSLVFSRSAVIRGAPGPDDAPQDVVVTVVTEVARSLRAYHGMQRGKGVDRIILAGDTGVEEVLAGELSRHVGLECVLFDPGPALRLGRQRAEAGGFISGLGLAVGHQKRDALPFDFVNPKRPPAKTHRMRRIAITAGAALAAVVLVGVVIAAIFLHGKYARVAALKDELAALGPTNKIVKDLSKDVAAIEKWENAGRPWLDHWALTSARFPPCTGIYVTGLEVTPDGSLQLGVRAANAKVIEALGEGLGAAGYDFKPGQITTIKTDPQYQISTKVRMMVDAKMKVDLTNLTFEPRPSDDASAELLASGQDVRREGQEQPATTAPGPTVTRSAVVSAPPIPTTFDSPEDREMARVLLERYDEDHDGKLAYREAYRARREVMRAWGPPWDRDGDGKMSSEEYSHLRQIMTTLQGGN